MDASVVEGGGKADAMIFIYTPFKEEMRPNRKKSH